ncbi:MAG: SDR family oxidoreductase [Spirochaetales bacterium]|nr:SDR family oxidoreductase [Spirochaetales bacterium]
MFELEGRVAIVSGAGSPRGIGRSIALALASQGAKTLVCDLNGRGAEEVAEEITRTGGTALAVRTDVTDESSVRRTAAAAVEAWGRLDILVNNAGITQPITVAEMTTADWNRVFAVNALGCFLFSKAAIPHMARNDFGRIVNMSSVSAKRGGGVFGGAHYSGAKAAVLGFGKALAREVAADGITVNAVTPGLVLTDIRGGVESEAIQREMTKDIPLTRMASAEEIGALVCFLASVEAGYITGEEVDINGGSHMD